MARTILVADDSPTVQKKASGILTGEGLEVVTVSNGVAAVKKLPAVKPLVVLADVSMPGKDGYEVCEFIKSSSDLRHIPVILIFSDTDPYEGQRGARVGADGTIKKPFDRDELIAKVSKFVAHAEATAPKPVAPPPAPAALTVEPVDEEPEVAARPEAPDLSSLPEGVAFGVPGIEEMPSVPAEPEPAPPEPVMGSEAFPETSIEPEMPAPEMEAMPPPEPPALEPPPVSADPVLIEEPTPPMPEPAAESTMMFRAPADIAEPILSDEAELSAPPVEPVSGRAVEPVPLAAPPEEPLAASRTLESYTLNEAVSGQVHFGAPAAEPTPEPEPVSRRVPPAARTLDADQIFAIVHKVVVKMSPPALSPQMIEEVARKFADEITAEFDSES